MSEGGVESTKVSEEKVSGPSQIYSSSHGGAEGERYSSEVGEFWSLSSNKRGERSG